MEILVYGNCIHVALVMELGLMLNDLPFPSLQYAFLSWFCLGYFRPIY